MSTQLVWLKRDIRLQDHRPLAEASQRGPCIILYVYEPEVICSAEFDASHLDFINQSLKELNQALQKYGAQITFRYGDIPDVFEALWQKTHFENIWSHQETGNYVSYQRDLRVADWAKSRGIDWKEFPQNGVIRRLGTRDGWSSRWYRRMKKPLTETPESIRPVEIPHEAPYEANELGVSPNRKIIQQGGESHAHEMLASFLNRRGVNYTKAMSSPVTAWNECSRLSAYLTYGNISIKQVYQAAQQQNENIKANHHSFDKRWKGSLSSFMGRLRWHCHFMQKLEDQPSIEFENMNSAYNGLREDVFDQDLFDAWCAGQTGYPLVDACMRCLHQTGWINFRMRAMLISFASYHLWLHWRPTAVYLAQHFLDFEPGIHFSQIQMQSGTTGINAIRIYSPIKQVKDHDHEGWFIRQYVPELEFVPNQYIAEPHKMPVDLQFKTGCKIGIDYPAPIVDHKTAYHEARERIYRAKGSAAARSKAKAVYQKHGSRRPGIAR